LCKFLLNKPEIKNNLTLMPRALNWTQEYRGVT